MNEYKKFRGRGGRGTYRGNHFRGPFNMDMNRNNRFIPQPNFRDNNRWPHPRMPGTFWRNPPPLTSPTPYRYPFMGHPSRFPQPAFKHTTRPPSPPLPGSEEARQKAIAEASARIQQQLNLSNETIEQNYLDDEPVPSCSSPTVDSPPPEPTELELNQPVRRRKRRSSTFERTDVENLRQKILTQFTCMSKGKIQSLVNNPGSTRYDAALQHLVRDMRLHLSSELRNMYNNPDLQSNQMIDHFNSIVPDLGVELVSLPDTMVAELSKILQLDNATAEPESPIVEPENMFKQAEMMLSDVSFLSETSEYTDGQFNSGSGAEEINFAEDNPYYIPEMSRNLNLYSQLCDENHFDASRSPQMNEFIPQNQQEASTDIPDLFEASYPEYDFENLPMQQLPIPEDIPLPETNPNAVQNDEINTNRLPIDQDIPLNEDIPLPETILHTPSPACQSFENLLPKDPFTPARIFETPATLLQTLRAESSGNVSPLSKRLQLEEQHLVNPQRPPEDEGDNAHLNCTSSSNPQWSKPQSSLLEDTVTTDDSHSVILIDDSSNSLSADGPERPSLDDRIKMLINIKDNFKETKNTKRELKRLRSRRKKLWKQEKRKLDDDNKISIIIKNKLKKIDIENPLVTPSNSTITQASVDKPASLIKSPVLLTKAAKKEFFETAPAVKQPDFETSTPVDSKIEKTKIIISEKADQIKLEQLPDKLNIEVVQPVKEKSKPLEPVLDIFEPSKMISLVDNLRIVAESKVQSKNTIVEIESRQEELRKLREKKQIEKQQHHHHQQKNHKKSAKNKVEPVKKDVDNMKTANKKEYVIKLKQPSVKSRVKERDKKVDKLIAEKVLNFKVESTKNNLKTLKIVENTKNSKKNNKKNKLGIRKTIENSIESKIDIETPFDKIQMIEKPLDIPQKSIEILDLHSSSLNRSEPFDTLDLIKRKCNNLDIINKQFATVKKESQSPTKRIREQPEEISEIDENQPEPKAEEIEPIEPEKTEELEKEKFEEQQKYRNIEKPVNIPPEIVENELIEEKETKSELVPAITIDPVNNLIIKQEIIVIEDDSEATKVKINKTELETDKNPEESIKDTTILEENQLITDSTHIEPEDSTITQLELSKIDDLDEKPLNDDEESRIINEKFEKISEQLEKTITSYEQAYNTKSTEDIDKIQVVEDKTEIIQDTSSVELEETKEISLDTLEKCKTHPEPTSETVEITKSNLEHSGNTLEKAKDNLAPKGIDTHLSNRLEKFRESVEPIKDEKLNDRLEKSKNNVKKLKITKNHTEKSKDTSEISEKSTDHSEKSEKSKDIPEKSEKSKDNSEKSKDIPEKSEKSKDIPEKSEKSKDNSEKSKDIPEKSEKSKDNSEKSEKSKDIPEKSEKSKDTPEKSEKSKDNSEKSEKSKDTSDKSEKSKDTPEKSEKSKDIPEKLKEISEKSNDGLEKPKDKKHEDRSRKLHSDSGRSRDSSKEKHKTSTHKKSTSKHHKSSTHNSSHTHTTKAKLPTTPSILERIMTIDAEIQKLINEKYDLYKELQGSNISLVPPSNFAINPRKRPLETIAEDEPNAKLPKIEVTRTEIGIQTEGCTKTDKRIQTCDDKRIQTCLDKKIQTIEQPKTPEKLKPFKIDTDIEVLGKKPKLEKRKIVLPIPEKMETEFESKDVDPEVENVQKPQQKSKKVTSDSPLLQLEKYFAKTSPKSRKKLDNPEPVKSLRSKNLNSRFDRSESIEKTVEPKPKDRESVEKQMEPKKHSRDRSKSSEKIVEVKIAVKEKVSKFPKINLNLKSRPKNKLSHFKSTINCVENKRNTEKFNSDSGADEIDVPKSVLDTIAINKNLESNLNTPATSTNLDFNVQNHNSSQSEETPSDEIDLDNAQPLEKKSRRKPPATTSQEQNDLELPGLDLNIKPKTRRKPAQIDGFKSKPKKLDRHKFEVKDRPITRRSIEQSRLDEDKSSLEPPELTQEVKILRSKTKLDKNKTGDDDVSVRDRSVSSERSVDSRKSRNKKSKDDFLNLDVPDKPEMPVKKTSRKNELELLNSYGRSRKSNRFELNKSFRTTRSNSVRDSEPPESSEGGGGKVTDVPDVDNQSRLDIDNLMTINKILSLNAGTEVVKTSEIKEVTSDSVDTVQMDIVPAEPEAKPMRKQTARRRKGFKRKRNDDSDINKVHVEVTPCFVFLERVSIAETSKNAKLDPAECVETNEQSQTEPPELDENPVEIEKQTEDRIESITSVETIEKNPVEPCESIVQTCDTLPESIEPQNHPPSPVTVVDKPDTSIPDTAAIQLPKLIDMHALQQLSESTPEIAELKVIPPPEINPAPDIINHTPAEIEEDKQQEDSEKEDAESIIVVEEEEEEDLLLDEFVLIDEEGLFCIGHQKSILDIKVVGDEFLAASEDGTIYKYDLKTGNLQDAYTGHSKAVTCMCVADGKLLDVDATIVYSGSLDCTFKCFNIETAEVLEDLSLGPAIQCMDSSWGYIFIGTYDGLLFIYDMKKKHLHDQSLTVASSTILMVKATQEGCRQVLIIGSRKREIFVRDAFTGLLLRTMCPDQKPTIYSLYLDRSRVYCGTSDKGILILDFHNGQQTGTYRAGKGVVCMCMHKTLLFAGCYDGMIYIYDTRKQTHVTTLPGPGDGMLLSLAINGRLIIAGGKKDHLLKIWRIPQEILKLCDENVTS